MKIDLRTNEKLIREGAAANESGQRPWGMVNFRIEDPDGSRARGV